MLYSYYAIFEKENDGYNISFPDLPGALSCADDFEEALYMAQDCLKGYLEISEEDNDYIPKASSYNTLARELKTNQSLQLFTVDTNTEKQVKFVSV